MKVLYRLTVDRFNNSNGEIIFIYGIEAVCDGEDPVVIKSVPALSVHKSKVNSVVKLFNRVSLSPIHLEDIITDEIIRIENPFNEYEKAARKNGLLFFLFSTKKFSFNPCSGNDRSLIHRNCIQAQTLLS